MKIRSIIAIMSLWLVFPIQGKAVNDSIQSVVDEVIWVVGDEAILKSDVEAMRIQAQQEGVRWKGDPDCAIPEQIAVQKLYLHQAAIDSIEVTEAERATDGAGNAAPSGKGYFGDSCRCASLFR